MLKTQFMVQQNGIRQKSLRRCCRFGHATETVFILATGATLLLPATASADSLTWDTPSIGNWNATDDNWNDGSSAVAFTNPADDAIFDSAADGATVTINQGAITAATLTSSAIGLTIDGATGTDTLAVTGLISITSGDLTLDTITTTTGAVTIASGATLNVNTNKVLSADSINNSGALTVSDGGTVEAAGEIHNESTGTVTFSGNAVLNSDSDSSGSEIVRNDGSIVVNSGVGTVDVASSALTNQGTGIIGVNTGTMNGISTLTNSSTSATAIDVASGATLGFTTLNSSAGTITATGTLDGNVVLTGTADLDLNDGTITGTLNNQSTTAITLQGTVTGAVVQNNAGAQTTIDGATILTGGFTNTSGTLTVETGNTPTLGTASSNAGTLDLNGDIAGGQTITNNGIATLAGDITGSYVQSSGGTTVDGGGIFITGGMDINGGALVVDQTIQANIDVANAATYDQNAAVTGNVTTASVNADIGANISGTLSQTGGQTNIDGAATIGGLITVSGGLLDVDVATTASSGISISSGVVNLNAATTLGAASSNAGTLTVGAATTLAGVLSNTGTLDVDANILGGQAVTNTGIATLAADIDGTFSQSAGSTTVDGASTNSGLTSITGGAFTVNTGQTFTAAGGFTNLGGTVNLLQNATLSGTTSLLSGSLVAQASGLSITGNITLGASATINMADGSTFTALTVSGALTGAGGIVSLDVDLNAGTSDTIVALGSEASTGTIQIALNDLTTAGSYGAISPSGIVLLDLESTSTMSATISGALPQDDQNVYVYSLGTINGDIVLLSGINNATAGLSGAIASAQSLIAAVINRPTSPFVTSLSAVGESEKCRPGAWVRMVGGNASSTGTATTSSSSTTTTTDTNFAGFQIGGDSTCFNSLIQENGWDLSYGLIAGYNIATSEQAIPNSSGSAINSITDLDMEQAYGGFYLVGARGHFSFDVQGQFEKTDFTVNSSAVSGSALPVSDSKFDITGYTLSAAASYAFSVPNQPQMFFVPTIGLSTTNTSDATLSFTDGSSLLLNETTTTIAFIGGTLAYSDFNEITGARTALFSTLTHYVNLSADSTSVFTDTSSSSTDITSSALPDYTELSFGYSYNRELRRNRTTGALRKLSASIRADGRFGSGFDSYGLTGQVRLQF